MVDTMLDQYRAQLDHIDLLILNNLSNRFEVIRAIATYKRDNGIAVFQGDRVKTVLKSRSEQAEQLGLDKAFVVQLWQLIIREACRLEETSSPVSSLPEGAERD